jgi:iron-sulfur cluster assembly protein/iron-sulfur cluster insertion protein
VKPGGCSGYSYEMFFDSEILGDDVVREFSGVRVVVDEASAELLAGATLDYSDGLQGAGFHITNPNATRTCGCGSSFS